MNAARIPMVVSFLPTGAVEAMYREDVLPLGFLGPQEVVRATEIRFDSESQTWGIWPRATEVKSGEAEFLPPPRDAAKRFASYETARVVEVQWLERCRLFSIDPLSESGLLVLDVVRSDHGNA